MTQETRLRRANDAVLTEMARSLLREDRPGIAGMQRRRDPLESNASAGRSTAAEAECARTAAKRFRRTPLSAPPAHMRTVAL